MRSLMCHIAFPHCTTDAVDQLDFVFSPEIADLIRQAANRDGDELARLRA